MDRFDRIFDLHRLLNSSRQPVSRARIEQELECSRATAKRTVEAMRLYLNAPIEYDRAANGYYYDTRDSGMYELPGIWFSASELFALLSVQQLLHRIQPGLLDDQLSPLKDRIDQLLKVHHAVGDDITGKVRIVQAAARPCGEYFQLIAGALARRKRLRLSYRGRKDDELSERIVSPQRLTHYRDNWYLDAWCHLREGLRTFALDAVEDARLLDEEAVAVDSEQLDGHYASAYGIFSGEPEHTAVLQFTPERARWVARERWHPHQQGEFLENGAYELRIPYSRSPELVMDILKYGPDVEVMSPESLRKEVAKRLRKAVDRYST